MHMNSLAFLGVTPSATSHGGTGLGDDLFVLVVIVVGGRDPVLEDGIEIGLDVVGVELVVVFLVLLALLLGGSRLFDLFLLHDDHHGIVVVVADHQGVVADRERLVVEVLGEHLFIEALRVEFLVVDRFVVSHVVLGVVAGGSAPHAAGGGCGGS